MKRPKVSCAAHVSLIVYVPYSCITVPNSYITYTNTNGRVVLFNCTDALNEDNNWEENTKSKKGEKNGTKKRKKSKSK